MRYLGWVLGMLLSGNLAADPVVPAAVPDAVAPLNQILSSVEYFREGRQSGCGLRATGDTKDNIWLNVLVTVFVKDNGATYGVVKVVARQVEMKDGVPLLRDGKMSYLSRGRISKAWIQPQSGRQPLIHQNGESPHSDGYMATVEFASTMDLLVAMAREDFKVGLSRDEADELYAFDQRLSQYEAKKLSTCMANLRAQIEERKIQNIF
ncbi:MAG: hypothetical protein HYZ46_07935 [Nitrosomonadales bacterium]|nr:hypothetical protein [Nitrosomonadales bacterium]